MSLALILGFVGIGLMVGLSGCGSAIGTSIGGSATVGALKRKEEAFASCLVLSALPGTQGLYGFAAFFVLKDVLTPEITIMQGAALLGSGILMGGAGLISAIYQGKVCAASASAIGSGHNTLGPGIVMAAMPEFYAILAFVASILIWLTLPT